MPYPRKIKGCLNEKRQPNGHSYKNFRLRALRPHLSVSLPFTLNGTANGVMNVAVTSVFSLCNYNIHLLILSIY